MSSENETKGGAKAEGRESQKNNMKAEGREGQNSKNAESREGQKTNKNAEREGQTTNKNAESREGQNNSMKAEGREGRDSNMKAEGREGQTNRSEMTTGQAGAGAKLSTEQRTKITTIIRNEHVAPLNNVNFSVAVGTRVPREGINLRPLPAEVVTIYPEWRGYEFVQVHQQILVIDPATLEIVAILEA
jgi:hypothetical protein